MYINLHDRDIYGSAISVFLLRKAMATPPPVFTNGATNTDRVRLKPPFDFVMFR